MFNMPQEAYFGDVETEGSAGAHPYRHQQQRATTPNRGNNNNYGGSRQNAYHPPPRVSHPTIATPVRHDVATSRVPLVDNQRNPPGTTNNHHHSYTPAATANPPLTTSSSQIFRGPPPSQNNTNHSHYSNEGRSIGTPRSQAHSSSGYTPFTNNNNSSSPNVNRRTGSPFDHRDRSIL